MNADDSITVAMSCKLHPSEPLMQHYGHKYRATITGVSETRDANFSFETGALHPTNVAELERWERHGFTVVELPTDWRFGRYQSGGRQNLVAKAAIERVESLITKYGEQTRMAGYDKELAREVLLHLNDIFPGELTNMQLKQHLEPEPSDERLLPALEALRKQGYIEGLPKITSTTGSRKVVAMTKISITPVGQTHLEGQTQALAITNNYINNGQAGAMGPNSTGTVNFQQLWSQIEN